MVNDFVNRVLTDLKVELTDEFDLNFTRKAFFDQAWPEVRHRNRRGSLMMRSGALRRSIRAEMVSNVIRWASSLPYARIQNEGGSITITRKMQKYFWAMYYSLAGKVTYSVKTRRQANNQRNRMLSDEAAYWKALALKKVGSKIRIPERRFIGHHRLVDEAVKRVADANFQELDKYIKQRLKPG
jgi:phage gpG-like protein